MSLIVVELHPNGTVFGQQISQQFEPRPHHGKPARVFEIVVVVLECRTRVVGGVDVDALYPPGVERQECLQRLQIVALDQKVPGFPVSGRELGNFIQQPVRHTRRRPDILFPG